MGELRAWMDPAKEKLDYITTTQDLTPEDRVKEIFDLQAQVNERTPLLEPMEGEAHTLLDAKAPVEGEEEGEVQHRSETAMRHMEEFEKIKEAINELHERVEAEAGSITQAQKLLEEVKAFTGGCETNKAGLDSAVESRNKMEKQTKSDNEVENLTNRWGEVKKVADERTQKVQELVDTWTELTTVTSSLTESIGKIAADTKPDVSGVEAIFNSFREINDKKVKIIETV